MTVSSYVRELVLEVMDQKGLANVRPIYDAALASDLGLAPACALMEKESGGRNVYGHDPGGALSGFPGEVNGSNWEVFWWLVHDQQQPSNGVGPAQLTYSGFFRDMLAAGLAPWRVYDNARYGFNLLAGYHATAVKGGSDHPWVVAGQRYNGALAYGEDLSLKILQWREALAPARVES